MFSLVFAQTPNPVCPPGSPAGENCAHTLQGLEPIFLNIVSILIPIGGIVLFIMIIAGGFYYITSSGDPRKVEGAKSTLTYAIFGIVLLAMAFFILQLIAAFVGVPGILNFAVVI